MARVEYQPYSTVEPTGAETSGYNINANPSEFGGLIGQGEQKLGAGAQEAGTNLMGAALAIQGMNNEAAARGASNQFMRDASNAWSQYGTLQGKAAADSYPAFQKQLEDIQNTQASSLGSPQARNDFLQASSYMLNRLTLMGSTHAATQTQQYWRQSHVANVENATNFGVMMQNDPHTVDTAANSVADSVAQIGKMDGWDPDRVTAETTKAVGSYYRTVILDQAQKDPTTAAATFARVRDRMDGVSVAETDRLLRPAMDNAAVSGAIDSITSGGDIHAAIKGQEGSGATAVSIKGAAGTMQVTPGLFKQYARPGESFNNDTDRTTVGNRAIDDYTQKYNGDPARVAVAYFSGPGNVSPPGSPTPWIEDKNDGPGGKGGTSTSAYVKGVLSRVGGPAPQDDEGVARGNAIPSRYFDEMQMVQRAYTQTANMDPRLRQRVIDGVFTQISHMNALENQAETRADRDLSNFQRDNGSILLGHTILGEPISEQDLGNMVRTQQITPTMYDAIKTIQNKQAEGRDDPVKTAQLWGKVSAGGASTDDVLHEMLAGNISGKTANEMVKTSAERAKTETNAMERGGFETLRTALNGKAIESGALDIFGEGKQEAAQLWSQAQGEWNQRVIFQHQDPQQVLSDMLPRYEKSIATNPKALPNPRYGMVQSTQDVASVAQKTKAAYEAGQITQDQFNEEGTLLNRYLTFYQNEESRKAAVGKPVAGRKPNLPMAPTDEGSR